MSWSCSVSAADLERINPSRLFQAGGLPAPAVKRDEILRRLAWRQSVKLKRTWGKAAAQQLICTFRQLEHPKPPNLQPSLLSGSEANTVTPQPASDRQLPPQGKTCPPRYLYPPLNHRRIQSKSSEKENTRLSIPPPQNKIKVPLTKVMNQQRTLSTTEEKAWALQHPLLAEGWTAKTNVIVRVQKSVFYS